MGALTNDKTPVAETIVNLAASAPPLMLKDKESTVASDGSLSGESESVAATVVTAVEFSATDLAAVLPLPSLVMVGAAFADVTTNVPLPLALSTAEVALVAVTTNGVDPAGVVAVVVMVSVDVMVVPAKSPPTNDTVGGEKL